MFNLKKEKQWEKQKFSVCFYFTLMRKAKRFYKRRFLVNFALFYETLMVKFLLYCEWSNI